MAAPVLIPAYLLTPCVEPGNADRPLALLKEGKKDEAATAFVEYVLDVRDAFEVCNGQIEALGEYAERMSDTSGSFVDGQ